MVDKWEGVVEAPSRYNLKLFADKETYEAIDELAKLQNKNAHQLAMEVVRNYVAVQQNGKSEWGLLAFFCSLQQNGKGANKEPSLIPSLLTVKRDGDWVLLFVLKCSGSSNVILVKTRILQFVVALLP